jgi:transcriptional regulator with XRE-family HTH domain
MPRSAQEKTARIQTLYDKGVPVKEIVRREKVKRTWAYSHITVSKAKKQEKQKLAGIIRTRLAELGKTQKWLTREIGKKVYHYARGESFPPEYTLKRIYSALGIEYAPLNDVYKSLVQSAKEKGFDSLAEYRDSLSTQKDKQKLAEIINTKLAELGKTQTRLGKEVGVTRASVSLYSQGRSIPKEDVFEKICAALGIEYAPISEVYENLVQSAKEKGYDSLEEYRDSLGPQKDKQKLAEIIKTRLEELRKTKKWLAEEAGLHIVTIRDYTKRRQFPREYTLEKILSALDLEPGLIDDVYENLVQSARKKGFGSLEEYGKHLTEQNKLEHKKQKLAEIIKTRLAELGKTQKWLVKETGRNKAIVSNYVRGINFPSEDKLEKILSALDLEPRPIDEVYENLVQSVRKKGFKSLEEYRVFLNVF